MGNRARVFCGEPCTDEALFVNAFIQSLDHVRSALGVRFLVSDDRVRRIPSACLDVVETSASGEVQGNPAENFSIDARRPRDFNYDGVTSASSLHFRVQWSTKTFSRGHGPLRYGRTVSCSYLLSIGVSFRSSLRVSVGIDEHPRLHPIRGVGRVECCCECARVGLQAGGFSWRMRPSLDCEEFVASWGEVVGVLR